VLFLCLGGASALADDNPQTSQTTTTPDPATVPSPEKVDVFFDTAKADVASATDEELKKLADWAMCNSKNAIILEGHADRRGTKDFNLKLSASRAAAVRQKLIDLGVPSNRIVVTVYGENGNKRATMAEDRRVSALPAGTPIEPSQLSSR